MEVREVMLRSRMYGTYRTLIERFPQRHTTVPDAPRHTMVESYHHGLASERDADGLLSSQIEQHPLEARLSSSRLLGWLEPGCTPCSNLQTHGQDKPKHTLLANIPSWPLFVPHANNSSADQQTEAVLQAAMPLILFPLRGPAIFRAVG